MMLGCTDLLLRLLLRTLCCASARVSLHLPAVMRSGCSESGVHLIRSSPGAGVSDRTLIAVVGSLRAEIPSVRSALRSHLDACNLGSEVKPRRSMIVQVPPIRLLPCPAFLVGQQYSVPRGCAKDGHSRQRNGNSQDLGTAALTANSSQLS